MDHSIGSCQELSKSQNKGEVLIYKIQTTHFSILMYILRNLPSPFSPLIFLSSICSSIDVVSDSRLPLPQLVNEVVAGTKEHPHGRVDDDHDLRVPGTPRPLAQCWLSRLGPGHREGSFWIENFFFHSKCGTGLKKGV